MKELPLNILIAEDNQYTALQYERILSKYGHRVVITKDGDECIKCFNEEAKKTEFESLDKNPFDLVILDQSMPKKTGAQVADEILTIKPYQRVIFASAYAMTSEKNAEKFKEKVQFLQKPFSLTKFVRVVAGQ